MADHRLALAALTPKLAGKLGDMCEEKCDARYIRLSVTPDGKSYTVSIPVTGHKRTFQTKK